MSDRNLKKQLIRLGNTNPELRGHLRPILNQISLGSHKTRCSRSTDEQKRIFKEFLDIMKTMFGHVDKFESWDWDLYMEQPVEWDDGWAHTEFARIEVESGGWVTIEVGFKDYEFSQYGDDVEENVSIEAEINLDKISSGRELFEFYTSKAKKTDVFSFNPLNY